MHPLIRANLQWCSVAAGLPDRRPHLFTDMLDMIPAGAFSARDSYAQKLYDVQRCWLQGSQMCHEHDDLCKIPEADFVVSGLPCTDMSRAGRHLLRHGPTCPVYMVHGKFHTRHRTPLLLMECTQVSGIQWNKYVSFWFFPGRV